MKQITLCFLCIFNISILTIYPSMVKAEPFVVLEYRGDKQTNYDLSDNMFLQDGNYNTKHTVLKNETLSDIMLKYYGSKSFNKNILSLAIVHFNKHAFVRGNPNFLFSEKNIYLPSVNEIKNLIIKKQNKSNDNEDVPREISSQIYFFGG
jgi:hypothetical protein